VQAQKQLQIIRAIIHDRIKLIKLDIQALNQKQLGLPYTNNNMKSSKDCKGALLQYGL
jgi:hypothetical protein